MSPLTPTTSLSPAPQVPAVKLSDKAQATARDFEAVFLGQMVKTMMGTSEAEGDFTGGSGEEMFRGVLAEKLGTEIAKRGGVGLAPKVIEQMIKMQEGNR
ncbi:MAG: chemotactic signal-response protein [Alphaproteobacteria bacterium]|nr:chemotactic signal-response protein [Alphaproteobacteria bacterium]MDB5721234.1 chemotactic signal-response protein [Alphaproteobacteria bacterium]